MPVEIKELNIKVTVSEPAQNSVVTASSADNGPEEDIQSIVETCVEKVLEILKNNAER